MIPTIVSRVFEPITMLSFVFLVESVRVGVPVLHVLLWMGLVAVPSVFFMLRSRLDWDIKDRKRRIKPLGMLFGMLILVSILVWVVEPLLVPVVLLFTFWCAGFLLITLFTKISGHTAGVALAAGVFWPLWLAVPVIAWARVTAKRHTVGETLVGAFFSFAIYEIWQGVF